MAGVKIVDLPSLGRDLISTDLLELSLVGGSGSRKITGQEIMNASKLNVGATPIINGTAGRILFQGAGDVLGESGNLFWDNTNGRLGVGTSSPSQSLDILSGNLTLRSSSSPSINIGTGGYPKLSLNNRTAIQEEGSTFMSIGRGYSNIGFYLSNAQIAAFASTGNLLINTGTDAGFKLDVNGTARVNNDLTIGSNRYLKAFRWTNDDVTRALQLEGNSNYNVDAVNIISLNNALLNNTKNLVNIGLASTVSTQSSGSTDFFNSVLIQTAYNFTGGTHTVRGIYYNPTLTSLTGTTHRAIETTSGDVIINTQTATATAGYTTLAIGGSTGAYFKMYVGTNPAAQNLRGQIWAVGNNLIFDNPSSGYLGLYTASYSGITILPTTGNVHVGTGATDAGYKLDVNGTARVNNMFSVTNASFTGSLRMESFGNNTQRIIGGPTENITFGPGNTIVMNTGEAYFSGSLLGNAFWMTSNGSTVIGAQANPPASALVEIRSTTKGFLPPRMTNAQRAAIASPAVGLIVYCTDSTEGLYVYKSTGWTFMV